MKFNRNLFLAAALVAITCVPACGGTIGSEGDGTGDTGHDTVPTDSTADTLADSPDSTPDSTPDVDPDAEPDGTPDVDTDGTSCPPGDSRCTGDLGGIETCRPDGTAYDAAPCTLGCANDPVPHCLNWLVSNLADPSLLTAGEPPTGGAWPSDQDYWVNMDTDTGAITLLEVATWTEVATLRPAGTGIDADSGISFAVVPQGEGLPDLGVFSFQALHIPGNYTYGVWGSLPMVLVSEEDALIEGGVFAGCFWEGTVLGGAAWGGEGPGVGGDGGSTPATSGNRDGGGGGGGYGGAGGMGGGYEAWMRGSAGPSSGSPGLVPLLGGSGGGWGGGTNAGRQGGASGGAVEIVSGGTLTIGPYGYVDAGGCGGQPATGANEGGGGGGSGGGILLEAPHVIVGGAVTANGGGGAGGGQGTSGNIWGENGQIATQTPAMGGDPASAYSCAGAQGDGGGGELGMDADACTGDINLYNAGGGGGGGGRIRLNGMTTDVTGILSPGAGSPAVTEGSLSLL